MELSSPASGTHRYFFKLYALDITLSLSAEAGHVLDKSELVGTYTK